MAALLRQRFEQLTDDEPRATSATRELREPRIEALDGGERCRQAGRRAPMLRQARSPPAGHESSRNHGRNVILD